MSAYISLISIFSLSAVPGEDYQEIKQQELVFGPSSTAFCTNIKIFDDQTLESTEAFTVSLTTAVEDSSVVGLSLQTTIVRILEDPTDGEKGTL